MLVTMKVFPLRRILFCFMFLFLLVSCQAGDYPKKTVTLNEETVQAETLIQNIDPVTSAVAIHNEKELYAAAEVEHMARLRLESIRKEAHERLTDQWPEKTIFFSTDKKALLELRKLNNDLAFKSVSKKEIDKRLSKIEEYMKG
ncbi:hypothetical protein [Bacillus piscicola]|uniref:hypothetical protein n=1 Tax=Bacillus piscicola TaxID=1632684 RepID=UPI001F0900FB|nr:hypothetical protein [Bacillus piscicola]